MAASARFEMGEVLGNTWRVARETIPSLWLIPLALFILPEVVLNCIGIASGNAALQALLTGVASLIAGGLNGLTVAAFVYAGSKMLNGTAVSRGDAFQRAVKVFLPLFGLSIIVALGVGLASVLLLLPGIFVGTCWSVAVPCLVNERIGVFDALGRSWRLTENCRWAILGSYIVVIITCLVIYFGVALLIGIGLVAGRQVFVFIYQGLLAPVVGAFVTILAACFQAAAYHELLRVKEGGGVKVAEVFA